MAIWPPKVVNKLLSLALVRQVATCCFHTCVYRRRSFYRIFSALPCCHCSYEHIHMRVDCYLQSFSTTSNCNDNTTTNCFASYSGFTFVVVFVRFRFTSNIFVMLICIFCRYLYHRLFMSRRQNLLWLQWWPSYAWKGKGWGLGRGIGGHLEGAWMGA